MEREVRVAVVGAGKAGTAHAQAFSEGRRSRVVRVMSRTMESAQKLAAACGAPRFGTDFAEVCRDPDVDAVVIASPDKHHHEQAVVAARSGKHILCEKPLCRSEEQAADMIRAAATARVVFMVDFVERFNHPCAEAKRRIDAGEIGRPAMILARRCHQKKVVRDRAWLNDQETGGVLSYAGTHNIDLMCWLMGSRPVRVYSESGRLVLDESQRFTDSAVMTLLFESGAIGCLYESFGYPGAYPHSVDRSIEVLGERGRLLIDMMRQPLSIVTDEAVTLADSITWPQLDGRLAGALRSQADHFVSCVLGGETPLAGGDAGLLSIRIAAAARKAAESGRAQVL